MKKIDLKLKEVYDFIVEYVENNSYPPTIRDICSSCSIKSTATAYSYVEKLKDQGLLNGNSQKKRSITLTNKKNDCKMIPLIGTIRAGSPIFAVENLEGYYPLPKEFESSSATFALKVKGNSMINAGIFDNDIIIVRQQNTASNGEIIVALIEDSATVKRLYVKNGKYILHPENDQMQDMIYDDINILGVVLGLFRKF